MEPPQLFLILVVATLSLQSAEAGKTGVLVAEISAGIKYTQISISLGTPPQQTQPLVLKLDYPISFIPCKQNPSTSSTYTPVDCSSNFSPSSTTAAQCTVQVTKKTSVSVFQDFIRLNKTSGKVARIPRKVFLGCSDKRPAGAAALSKHKLALPLQLASAYKIPRKFAICLSPIANSSSSIFFGDDSSFVFGGINISNYVEFIPFVTNPVYPFRYYIGLTGIRVDSSDLRDKLPTSVFAIDPKTGIGGLKLSTKDRYTKLPTPAYSAVAEAFKSYATKFNISMLPPPDTTSAKLCFNASQFNYNRLGPVVPVIEFVFGNVSWSLGGSSSIDLIEGGAVGCLAFDDAGSPPVTSSIGLFQQFDNLLHFDIAGSRFGFVDRSLRLFRQSCRSSGL